MAVRMLCRPPSSSSSYSLSPSASTFCVQISGADAATQASETSAVSPGSGNGGVIVVGAIGRLEEDVSQLLNRLLDARVFGSNLASNYREKGEDKKSEYGGGDRNKGVGRAAKHVGAKEDIGKERLCWMKNRLQHYYDEERGLVYVLFAWNSISFDGLEDEAISSETLSAALERREADSIRGLLFMFSVCHVILLVQERARFEPKMLRMFRILQAAKHALIPFVKTQVLPGLLPTPSSRNMLQRSSSLSSSNSPGRAGSNARQASTIALMSGSAPTLFPGQCTPVVLFVYLEDTFDAATLGSYNAGHANEIDLQNCNCGQLSRQSLLPKLANMATPATRIPSKVETGPRRKFQSSLEAQIRFLIKKCRTVVGLGDAGHFGPGSGPGMGPRGPGGGLGASVSGGALFTLDSTRAVILLGRPSNRCTESLDAITDSLDELLNGKEGTDDAQSESSPNIVADDIQGIKDFLSRQAEILRGRGGMPSSSTGGSVGVGMVAAAAAAAAASAAGGSSGVSSGASKAVCNPPELPSMSVWLAACNLIIESLMTKEAIDKWTFFKVPEGAHASVRRGPEGTIEATRPGSGSMQNKGTIEAALTCIENAVDMDMKFSASWCRKILPAAQEVYLKGLPACYPSAIHNVNLEKALHVFRSSARGPAVQMFVEKLKQDCKSVWKSGRRLCDAQSLTGNSCIHQVHLVAEDSQDLRDNTPLSVKSHSSGAVYLHACACGRSRKLRDDPFDFQSANVKFYQFPNCENLLPSIALPDFGDKNRLSGSSWSLVRLGSAVYYEPTIGLLQSGFCSGQNFLFPWNIPVSYKSISSSVLCAKVGDQPRILNGEDISRSNLLNSKVNATSGWEYSSSHAKITNKVEEKKPSPKKDPGNSKRDPGVTKLNYTEESAFPPLPQKQDRALQKPSKHVPARNTISALANQQHGNIINGQKPDISIKVELPGIDKSKGSTEQGLYDNRSSNPKAAAMDQITIYIGFEHECPSGHRFFLSPDHIRNLGPLYSEYVEPSSIGQKQDKESGFGSFKSEVNEIANGEVVGHAIFKSENFHDSKGNMMRSVDITESLNVGESSGDGFLLLNSNLPIYLNCPHCKVAGTKPRENNVHFASTTSQLQRIFLVTPPFPLLLSSRPTVQFEESASIKVAKQDLQFGFDCDVLLPPESFLSLRLPFVYFVEQDNQLQPLLCKSDCPENNAWLVKGTTVRIASKVGLNR